MTFSTDTLTSAVWKEKIAAVLHDFELMCSRVLTLTQQYYDPGISRHYFLARKLLIGVYLQHLGDLVRSVYASEEEVNAITVGGCTKLQGYYLSLYVTLWSTERTGEAWTR